MKKNIIFILVVSVAILCSSIYFSSRKETGAGHEHSASTVASTPSAPSWAEKFGAALDASNVPIVFWGIVTDESGKGLSNVNIKFSVGSMSHLNYNGVITRSSLTADADGRFKIDNVSGINLEIDEIQKNGYVLYALQTHGFAYARSPILYTPSETSPQPFMMRLAQDVSRTKNIEWKINLRWDGIPVRYDLTKGCLSETGSLIIIANRAKPQDSFRFDWSLSIEIEGGKLFEAKEGLPLLAPETGYASVWKCGHVTSERDWSSGKTCDVFYSLNGNYGRLNLNIYSERDPTSTSIHIANIINESGGRNTEEP